MSYSVFRVEGVKNTSSLKGLCKHNKDRISNTNPDIDKDKSKDNIVLVECDGTYNKKFNEITKEMRIQHDERMKTMRADRVKSFDRSLDDSSSDVACEMLFTSDEKFFENMNKDQIRQWAQESLNFVTKDIGIKKENIIHAVVHMDEKTPHMHLSFVPITQDGRLCAKEILGNKKKLTWWQDEFWKHMVEKYPDLERGEAASMTGREHIPPRLFKEAAHLTRQAKQITDLLENTNFFNAGKNTDKAVELLQKFFPAMENFQTQVRKYDRTISSLKSDNVSLKRQTQDLSRQVKEATSSSIRKKMDDVRLRADYENLQNLMNRIPPEILELAKRGQLTHSDRER